MLIYASLFAIALHAVPDDFDDVLDFYTRQGYRVLALAYKPLDNTVNLSKVSELTR